MNMVISIDDELYQMCKDLHGDADPVERAIANGIPLPKGHGRLKDVDWIDDNCENHYSDKDGSWCYTWRDIDDAPTIIEADKAESKEEV